MSRRKTGSRAYTMVEVMAALGVLTVGAFGVIAMEKSVQIANANARMLATANAVAETWVERLRADAMQWNNPGGIPDLGDTTWVKQVQNGAGFFSPLPVPGSASTAADIHGADVFPGDPTLPAFCTHVSMTQLDPTSIAVTVRTVWIRGGRAIDCTLPPNDVDIDPTRVDPVGYGAVYLSTAVFTNEFGG
ncbi:MAG TPA: prepilin-type cleavage/methylation domain-containing protein [Minicystis sp.]|nr:prepilin-type cleavage/methylation domain-containing protein [Minicystis sp.]